MFNVGGNFGQILEQGQQNRENMRLQAEIANMRYGNRGNNSSSEKAGGNDDTIKYMKFGLEMAETKAKLDQLGEQVYKQKVAETNADFTEVAKLMHKKDYAGAAEYFRNVVAPKVMPGKDVTFGSIFDEQSDSIYSKGAPATFGDTQHLTALADRVVQLCVEGGLDIDYTEKQMQQEEQMQNGVGDSQFATMDGNEKYIPGKKWKNKSGSAEGIIPAIKNKIAESKERKQNQANNLSGGQNIPYEEGAENEDYVASDTINGDDTGYGADEGYIQGGDLPTRVYVEDIENAIKAGDLSKLPEEYQNKIKQVMDTTVVGINNKGEPVIVELGSSLQALTAEQNKKLEAAKAAQQSRLDAYMRTAPGKQAIIDNNTKDIHMQQQQITANIQAMQQQFTDHAAKNFSPNKASGTFATIGEMSQSGGSLDTSTGVFKGGGLTKIPQSSISINNNSAKQEDPNNAINETNTRNIFMRDPKIMAATGGKVPQTAQEIVQAAASYRALYGESLWDVISPYKNAQGNNMTFGEAATANVSKDTLELLNKGEVSALDGAISELMKNPKDAQALARAKSEFLAYLRVPEASPDGAAMRAAINRLSAAQFQELRSSAFTPKSVQEVLFAASKAAGDAPLILKGLARFLKDRISVNFNRVLDSKTSDYLAVAKVNSNLQQLANDFENLGKYISEGYTYVNRQNGAPVLKNTKTNKLYELGPNGELAPLEGIK